MWIDDRYLKADANNFTLVRLVLASAVIVTHCYWMATGALEADPLSPLLGRPISYYAVDGFFFLSGFLVYASLLKRGDAMSFTKARLARIWPGLAVSVLLVVAFGAFFTTAPLGSYLGGDTARFIWGNLALVSGGYHLTGIECGGVPCNINGSLWTIAWEIRCYALLVVLFLLGLAGRKTMLFLILPTTFLFAIGWHWTPWATAHPEGIFWHVALFDRLWTMFALGIGAYILRDRIYLNWWILLALLGATIVEFRLGVDLHMGSLFIAYGVLCGGLLSARKRAVSGTWPDYSYGMYIYAFPVMMVLGASGLFSHYLVLALANALATLPLAMASWHFVEKPVLDGMRHWSQPKAARAPA